MKKFMLTKTYYFIWAILVAAFNLVLFLIVKDKYNDNKAFWFTYGFVMLAFVVLLLLGLFGKSNNTKQDLFIPFALPGLLVIIFYGIIVFFFVSKIHILGVIIPFVCVYSFILIGIAFSFFYQSSLKYVPEKKVEIINWAGFVAYINELSANNTDARVTAVLDEFKQLLSEPISESSDDTKPLEKRIYEYAGFMAKDLKDGVSNNFFQNAEKCLALVKQRKAM